MRQGNFRTWAHHLCPEQAKTEGVIIIIIIIIILLSCEDDMVPKSSSVVSVGTAKKYPWQEKISQMS